MHVPTKHVPGASAINDRMIPFASICKCLLRPTKAINYDFCQPCALVTLTFSASITHS